MSDGLRFFSYPKFSKFNGISTTRELGDIPGILIAQDIFVQETDDRGNTHFVIKNKSKPYIRSI